MANVIGNASLQHVTDAIATSAGTLVSNDGGKIATDGSGNMTVTGNVTVTGTLNATIGGTLSPTAFKFPSSKFADLPATPAAGDSFLVTDGLKPGETTGAGTGVLAVYDGSHWVDVSAGTTVAV